MSNDLPAIIAHVRAQARPNSYGGMLLAEIGRLQAAIQAHHDTKHGIAHTRAVMSPPDLALYVAASIDHRVPAWQAGGDCVATTISISRQTQD